MKKVFKFVVVFVILSSLFGFLFLKSNQLIPEHSIYKKYYEWGYSYGKSAREEILNNLALMSEDSVNTYMSFSDDVDNIFNISKESFYILKGISDSIGCNFADIVKFNCESSLIEGCSTFALVDKTANDKRIIIGKTRDLGSRMKRTQAVIIKPKIKEHSYIGLFTVGSIYPAAGINDSEVLIVNTDVDSKNPVNDGLFNLELQDIILQTADTVDEAIQIINQAKLKDASTYYVSDRSKVVVVEKVTDEPAYIEEINNFSVRTNYFLDQNLSQYNKAPASSCKKRYEIIYNNLSQGGIQSETDAMNLLRNHTNGPSESICKHGYSYVKKTEEVSETSTVSAMVFSLQNGQFKTYLSVGQPCTTSFVELNPAEITDYLSSGRAWLDSETIRYNFWKNNISDFKLAQSISENLIRVNTFLDLYKNTSDLKLNDLNNLISSSLTSIESGNFNQADILLKNAISLIEPKITIISSAGTGGSISPSNSVTVSYGGSQTFTITPNVCYTIKDVKVDGVSVGAVSTYAFTNVTSDHTIEAIFEPISYNISATSFSGGSISPSGTITVNPGESKTFTITPNTGYRVKVVLVDGVSVGAVSTYTFDNVTQDHTIEAQFEPTTFTITASSGVGGTITPTDTITVNYGNSKTFTITPNQGYKIKDVLVDGKSVGTVSTYTFTNITSNHTIEATFEKEITQTTIILQIGNSSFTVNNISNTLDSPPVIKNNRTLLPIRAIIEALGGTVGWDGTEKKVTVFLGSNTIELWIGKSLAKVNGIDTPIDSANLKVVPEIINGRTMLPLRFVTENLGCDVQWDGPTQTITITYQG